MSEPSKQKSTELSTVDPGMLGGLVLLSIPFIPILIAVGLFNALDLVTEDIKVQKKLNDSGKEDMND